MAVLRRSAILSLSGLLLAGAIVSQPSARAAPARTLAHSHALKSGSLAKVRAIKRGLQVAPPSRQYAKGKVKEVAGKVTGDKKLSAEGKADKVSGKIRSAIGGLKDAVRGR